MNTIDFDTAMKTLDESAQAEYHTSYLQAVNVEDEELKLRRIARLGGIELKRPFARAEPIGQHFTFTGSFQAWELRNDIGDFSSLAAEPAYQVQAAVYEILTANPQLAPPSIQLDTFATFLESSLAESNWFFALLRAAQPYLCEDSASVKNPSSPEQKKEFWKAVAEAAQELGKKGAEKAVETAASALVTLVPFLAVASPALIFTATFVIVHAAKGNYCKAEIQNEIIQTLGLRFDP